MKRFVCRLRPACGSALLLLLALEAGAATLFSPDRIDPRQIALGGHPAALASGPLALAANPALLADGSGWTLAAGALRPDGMPELGQAWTGISCLLSSPERLALAAVVVTSGDEVWRENSLCLGIAGRLFGPVAVGLAARFNTLAIEDMGQASAFALDIGFTVTFDATLRLGFAIDACNEPALGRDPDDRLPAEIAASIIFLPAAGMTLGGSLACDTFGASPAIFAEIEPLAGFFLRAAIETAVPALASGIGIDFSGYGLDYAVRANLNGTSLSHAVAVSWRPDGERSVSGLPVARVDINSASRPALLGLPLLTGRLAERIIREREQRRFCRIEDIVRVKGISYRFLRRNRDRLAVNAAGDACLVLTNRRGQTSRINDFEIRDLVARGLRADAARRVILLRNSLGGFVDATELELVPGCENGWTDKVFDGT